MGHADARTLGKVYGLLLPGGSVSEPHDLGIVFPELGVRDGGIWSMLYLAGYLTTDDTARPNSRSLERRLRIPDREIAELYRDEVIDRFADEAGGRDRLRELHEALVWGDEARFGKELGRVALHASTFDLTSELPCHMLLMGLLFGVRGYEDPLSNREVGTGRYDMRLVPSTPAGTASGAKRLPLVTVELKYLHLHQPADADGGEALDKNLSRLAHAALLQIAAKGYDAEVPPSPSGWIRWGVAFCGKRVAVACESGERR